MGDDFDLKAFSFEEAFFFGDHDRSAVGELNETELESVLFDIERSGLEEASSEKTGEGVGYFFHTLDRVVCLNLRLRQWVSEEREMCQLHKFGMISASLILVIQMNPLHND